MSKLIVTILSSLVHYADRGQSCSLSFRAIIAHQSLSNSLPTPASNLASLASSRPPHLVVTLTPFQKATYPAMFFAASLGAA